MPKRPRAERLERISLLNTLRDACDRRDPNAASAHLSAHPFLCCAYYDDWHTTLHAMCMFGFSGCVRIIDSDPNAENQQGRTALHLACIGGHTDCVRELLRKPLTLASVRDNDRATPLHMACTYGTEADVRLLLRHGGMEVNAGDNEGMTPLHRALAREEYGIVDCLLKCARIDTRRRNCHGRTALHMAVKLQERRTLSRRAVRAISQIIGSCADCANIQDNDGNTPLHFACQGRRACILAMCLSIPGVDTTIRNDDGLAAVHILAMHGTPGMWKLALACPSLDLNVATSRGKSVLECAWRLGAGVCDMIVHSGRYDVNRRYVSSGTAVTFAASRLCAPRRLADLLPYCSDETLVHAAKHLRRATPRSLRDELDVRRRWGVCVEAEFGRSFGGGGGGGGGGGARFARCLVVHMMVLASERGYGCARTTYTANREAPATRPRITI